MNVFRFALTTLINFVALTFAFPIFLVCYETNTEPHFDLWRLPQIKASSYGPQTITSVIENAEKNVKEYEFYYAISGNDSSVDWIKPDTVTWQKFSVSESPQAILDIGSWEKYSGKYLLVKGILKTEKGETVSSTYFTQNTSEYINNLYEIPNEGIQICS